MPCRRAVERGPGEDEELVGRVRRGDVVTEPLRRRAYLHVGGATFTFTQFMFTFTRHLHVRVATRNMLYSYTEERWITTALHVSAGFEAATRYTSESEAHSARATQERGGQIRCESSCRIRFVYVSIRSALVLQSFCCRFGSL